MEEIKKWPPSKEEFEELYIKQNLKDTNNQDNICITA